ncbi:hypothetical protein [Acrocarpospora sp. B8E8]|uniref:hypothetical protein n=1 Tax=Acrocarpospora sp. B8E8 TaxID=3153572 RepID=UPI00325C6CE8
MIRRLVEDVELRHGFTLMRVNGLAVFAVKRGRFIQGGDLEERAAVAWSAIVEHLYAVTDPPTISDVVRVAWRAVGDQVDRDRRSRGLNTNDRYAGVTAGV